jgi:hypothetical protein
MSTFSRVIVKRSEESEFEENLPKCQSKKKEIHHCPENVFGIVINTVFK